MMFSVPKYLNEPQNYFKGEWSKSQTIESPINSLDWSGSGTELICGGSDMVLINLVKNRIIGQQRFSCESDNEIVKVKFIDENLYGCMNRNNIKLWDVREKCVKGVMGFSSYELEDFDWLTGWTAPQVATLSEDNQVKVYDYRMAQHHAALVSMTATNHTVLSVMWEQNGGDEEKGGKLQLSSHTSIGNSPECMNFHQEEITSVAINSSHTILATGGADYLLLFHHLPDLLTQLSIGLHHCPESIQFSPCGDYLAIAYGLKFIDVYHLYTRKKCYTIDTKKSQRVTAWNPKNSILAFVDRDLRRENSFIDKISNKGFLIRLFAL